MMLNSYPENDYRMYLEHSSKGSHWKKGHKYIAIKNGRYIYPEDLKTAATNILSNTKLGKEMKRKQTLKEARRDIAKTYYSSFDKKTSDEKAKELNKRYENNRKNRSTRRQQKTAAGKLKRKHTINKVKNVLSRVFK